MIQIGMFVDESNGKVRLAVIKSQRDVELAYAVVEINVKNLAFTSKQIKNRRGNIQSVPHDIT